MGKYINVTDDTFDNEVLKSSKPVLVDFWASWCAPCRMVAPIVEEIANERNDVTIAKVDVDANPQISTKYGIRSIPTLYVFKGGQIVGQLVGAAPKPTIEAELNKHV